MTRQDGPDERDREFLPGPVTIIEWPAHCLYCRTSFLSLDAARAHDATCPKHPAVIQVAEAEAHAREVTRLLAECCREKADLVEVLHSLATFTGPAGEPCWCSVSAWLRNQQHELRCLRIHAALKEQP